MDEDLQLTDHFLEAGWLWKRRDGAWREGWCHRFVALTKHHLFYYTGRHGLLTELRGIIQLVDVTKVSTARSAGDDDERWLIEVYFPSGKIAKKTAFGLGTSNKNVHLFGRTDSEGNRSLVFGAGTEAKAKEWADLIRKAAEASRAALMSSDASGESLLPHDAANRLGGSGSSGGSGGCGAATTDINNNADHCCWFPHFHGFFEGKDKFYAISDFVSGGELYDALKHKVKGAMPERQAARLASWIARGIHHMHARGIVHLDIS
eukprot:g4358.t1